MNLELMFQQCANDDWSTWLETAKVLHEHGYVFTTRPFNSTDIPESETDNYLSQKQPSKLFNHEIMEFSGYPKCTWNTQGIGTFSRYPKNLNKLTIVGFINDNSDHLKELIETYAAELLKYSQLLYPLLKPSIGRIDKLGIAHDFAPSDGRVARIRSIGWVNYFGLPVVEKYGRDFLLNLSGYKSEELSDGGIFHQMTETFFTDKAISIKDLRAAVNLQFRANGYKFIVCKAPYRRPSY